MIVQDKGGFMIFTREGLILLMRSIGNELLEMRKENLDIHSKKHKADIQTKGDRYSESELVKFFQKSTPDIGIWGEEGANQNGSSDKKWYIDPIDGTIPYSAQRDNFSISVGLVENGKSIDGYIYFPAKNIFLNFSKSRKDDSIKINTNEVELSNAVIGFDFSAKADRENELQKFFLPLCAKVRYVFMEASFTGATLNFLQGKLQAYVHPSATPFDLAAAMVAVEEAGGVIRRLGGGEIDLNKDYNPVIMAVNKKLADDIENCLSL